MFKTLFVLGALLASTCEVGPFPKPAPQPEPPSPWDNPSDAAPPPEDIDAAAHSPCSLACQKLAKLGCQEAKPTANGATCTQVCANNESGPMATSLDPACVARASTCKSAAACVFGP